MAQEENMTREQVEEEMRQLRKVFDSVQLFTQEMIQDPKGRRPCYAHWKRTRPCENCVARRALEEKGRKSRLEYMGKTLYEVTACYVLVEDRPCVLEMAQKMDRGMVLGRMTAVGCSIPSPTRGKGSIGILRPVRTIGCTMTKTTVDAP